MRWLVGFLQDNLFLPAWGSYKLSPAFKTKIISNLSVQVTAGTETKNIYKTYKIKDTTHFSPIVAQAGCGSVWWVTILWGMQADNGTWLQCGQQWWLQRPGSKTPAWSWILSPLSLLTLTPTQHKHGECHNLGEPFLLYLPPVWIHSTLFCST